MSVKKELSGRRSVEVEVEVPGPSPMRTPIASLRAAAAIFVILTRALHDSVDARVRIARFLGAAAGRPVWTFQPITDLCETMATVPEVTHHVVFDSRDPSFSRLLKRIVLSYDDSEVFPRLVAGAGVGGALAEGPGAIIGGFLGVASADKGAARSGAIPVACPYCRAGYQLYLAYVGVAWRCPACTNTLRLAAGNSPGLAGLSHPGLGGSGSLGLAGLPLAATAGRGGAQKPRRRRHNLNPDQELAFEFDIALSFAAEQREFVEQVAELARANGIKVFYDDFDKTNSWGKDLAVHFDEVYRKRARFVVPFISRQYAEKAWPRHEFKSALARAVQARAPYLLPVRFDDTELPGLQPTVAYLDGRQLSPEEIVKHILAKLRGAAVPPAPAPIRPMRMPSLPPQDFNPFAEAERVIAVLRQHLSAWAKELGRKGFGIHASEGAERFAVRIMKDGTTVWHLDVWVCNDIGENTICFNGGLGANVISGASNAHGIVEWDRARGFAVVKVFNLSLLPEIGRDYRLTAVELAEAIWEELCRQLESAS